MKTIKNKKIFKDKLRNEGWNEKKGGVEEVGNAQVMRSW